MKSHYLLPVFIFFISVLNTSCKNEVSDPTVTYELSTKYEDFDISYLDEKGENIKKTIRANYWTTSFPAKKGDSVSMKISANNLNDKIKAKIIYNGKVLKEVVTYGQNSGENVSAAISTKIPY